jgi:hypothetical protein
VVQYHGWQFGTGGQCELIPSEPSMRPGKPFCVYSYPTTEVYVRDLSTSLSTTPCIRLVESEECLTSPVMCAGPGVGVGGGPRQSL